MTNDKINQIYSNVMKKASMDEKFRKKLLSDPNLAIEELTGEKLPNDYKIKVIESDPAYSATFVLPKQSTSSNLSSEELGNVAGGVNVSKCNQDIDTPIEAGNK